MYEQLSTELKASLFQRIKSPFFGSYFIFVFILNYKFTMLLLSGKDLEYKFNMINSLNSHLISIPNSFIFGDISANHYSFVIYPALLAFLYISLVPFLEYFILMPIWKKHQKRLKQKYASLEGEEVFLLVNTN